MEAERKKTRTERKMGDLIFTDLDGREKQSSTTYISACRSRIARTMRKGQEACLWSIVTARVISPARVTAGEMIYGEAERLDRPKAVCTAVHCFGSPNEAERPKEATCQAYHLYASDAVSIKNRIAWHACKHGIISITHSPYCQGLCTHNPPHSATMGTGARYSLFGHAPEARPASP